eukprot:gene7706-13533_t
MKKTQIDINGRLEAIGFGKFQIISLTILCLRYFSYSSTSGVLAILEPYLRCRWKLSYMTAAWLVLPEAITKIAGSILLGKLSDRYGRRAMMVLAFIFNSYLTLLYALSSNVLLMSVIRGFTGLLSASSLIAFVYAMEILPASERKYMSLFPFAYCAGCGYSILAAMASFKYLTWRWFVIFAETMPMALSAFAVFFLPESPRYLLVTGRQDEAEASLQKIAKMNGFKKGYEQLEEGDSKNCDITKIGDKEVKPEEQPSMSEVTKRIAAVSFLQFYVNALGETMRFGSMQFGENSDISECRKCSENLTYKYRWAVMIAPLFSFVAAYLFLGKSTRMRTFKVLIFYLALCLIPFYWVLRGWYLMVVMVLTSMGTSTLNDVLVVYRAEIIPTSMRVLACGIPEASSQLGSLFGQIVVLYVHPVSIELSFGILHCFTAFGFLVLFIRLVETRNKPLE